MTEPKKLTLAEAAAALDRQLSVQSAVTELEAGPVDYPEDLPGYVAAQRARAAFVIARDLPVAAADVRQAVMEANSPRMALAAQQKAVAFGIMLDKLDQLVKPGSLGRYGRKPTGDSEPSAYPSLDDISSDAESSFPKRKNSVDLTRAIEGSRKSSNSAASHT